MGPQCETVLATWAQVLGKASKNIVNRRIKLGLVKQLKTKKNDGSEPPPKYCVAKAWPNLQKMMVQVLQRTGLRI